MASAPIRFRDRLQAGRLLAARLSTLNPAAPVIYALPRGGVPVGWEIAQALQAPLDVILVRKIGAPGEPELAAAVAVEGGTSSLVVNNDICLLSQADTAYLARAARHARAEIARRGHALLAGRDRVDPAGRAAIVADDGLATGATARAALQFLRDRGAATITLAVPVAPPDALRAVRNLADTIVCLAAPATFRSVSAYYDDFHQLTDREAQHILNEAAKQHA